MSSLKKSQRSLRNWSKQDWGTKSGKPSAETGERYLPKKAIESLSDSEYAATTAKKRKDTAAGKQHSKQPKRIAKKTRGARQFKFSGGKIQDAIGTELYKLFRVGGEKLGFGVEEQKKARNDAGSYISKYNKLNLLPYNTYQERENVDEIFTHVLAAYRLGNSKIKRTAFQSKDLIQANLYRNDPASYIAEKGDFQNNKVGFYLRDTFKEDEQAAMDELAQMIGNKDERLYFQ